MNLLPVTRLLNDLVRQELISHEINYLWLPVRHLRILLALFLITAVPLFAQDRSYGRSMVINDGGIVATSHTLASQAGAQILARGGSAMDAAIAANAVLGVTEPMMNGIGGDLFPALLGRQDWQALRVELQRMGAARTFDRLSETKGHDADAAGRH